jgi:pectate lyase
MDYGIASTQEADVVVQANAFKAVANPTFCGYDDSDPGDIVEFDNLYEGSGLPQTRGQAFDPKVYYSFTPDPAADVPWLVMTHAGAGRVQVGIASPSPSGS